MNAEPSLDLDVMRATDLFGGPFTPPGFYYKTFIRPRRFWPLYEKFLRHAAGLGKLRKSQPEREWRTEYRRRHADVLVIGGGAAGLSAAAEAAELGADVVLADEGPEPGGRLLAEGGVAVRARARRAGAHRRRRGARERARAGHVRRPRAGLGGRHAPPDPRAANRVRHRRDRAAAALPGQRPAGRDAVRRRAPARRHVRGAARDARGGGDRRRPRAPRGARAARRGGGDLLRRRPPRPRERRARRPRCSATNVAAHGGHDGARGARPQPRLQRGDREARLGRGRDDRVRPARGVGRERAGHLARRAGGREDRVRRVARPLRARRGAGRRAGGGRGQGQGGTRVRPALGNDRGRGGGPRARASATRTPAPGSSASASVIVRTLGPRRSPCRRP